MEIKAPDVQDSQFSSLSITCNACIELVYPCTPITFRHRDGLPIKISTKIIATLNIKCVHDIDNILSVAVKPEAIEWLIEGQRKACGAFKIGHSDDAKYHSRDYGECVIYHPPLESTKVQEIEIKLRIKYATGGSEYRLNIDLQRQAGFGKGLSSLATVRFKSDNPINLQNLRETNCRICKPKFISDKPANEIIIAGAKENDSYLMTSEYVKMQSLQHERAQMWLASSNHEKVSLGSLLPDQDLEWKCSAGSFVGANTGSSVVYIAPPESELSKSPVNIVVQADGKIVATRRFWLLRRPSAMHC